MRYVRRKIAIREARARRRRVHELWPLARVIRVMGCITPGKVEKRLQSSGRYERVQRRAGYREEMDLEYRAWMASDHKSWPPSEIWAIDFQSLYGSAALDTAGPRWDGEPRRFRVAKTDYEHRYI